MKYYRNKKRDVSSYRRKETLCWDCKRCFGGCSWSREFIPVNGWIAEKTHIPSNGEYAASYKVIDCPEYRKDERV